MYVKCIKLSTSWGIILLSIGLDKVRIISIGLDNFSTRLRANEKYK
jgi:hypothetical protein